MGSEGHQDIDLAILTALLKGGFLRRFVRAYVHLCAYVCMHWSMNAQ